MSNMFLKGGIIVGVLLAAVYVFRRFVSTTAESDSNEEADDKDDLNIERVQSLSYELILSQSRSLISSWNLADSTCLSLGIMPQSLSIEYLKNLQSKTSQKVDPSLLSGNVVVTYIQRDTDKKVLDMKVYVAESIANDFNDFVPSDKIYLKKIKIKNAD